MKHFFQIFLICLIIIEVFFFFGGGLLFDLSRHYYGAGAAIAFFITIPILIFTEQNGRIAALEKRIQKLEDRDLEHGEP